MTHNHACTHCAGLDYDYLNWQVQLGDKFPANFMMPILGDKVELDIAKAEGLLLCDTTP